MSIKSSAARRTRAFAAAAGVCAVGLVLSACGSGSSSSSGAPASGAAGGGGCSSSNGADVAAAKAAVDTATGLPKYEPLSSGGPIGKADWKSKLVYEIKYADYPYNQAISKAVVDGLKVAGVRTRVVNGDGTPQSWAAGIQAAIADHADAINLNGFAPEYVAPQIKEAQAAGIIVTEDTTYGTPQQMPPPIIHGGTSGVWSLEGKGFVDKIVADACGPTEILYVHGSDIGGNDKQMKAGFDAELKAVCSGCSVVEVDQPVAKWADLAQPIAAALTAHPDIRYIAAGYDSGMVPGIEAGIKQAGINNNYRVATGDGSASIIGTIKPGSLVMADIGQGVTWVGDAIATNILRQLAGGKPHIYTAIPRMFDESNASEAGDPPSYTSGFGDSSAWTEEIQQLLNG